MSMQGSSGRDHGASWGAGASALRNDGDNQTTTPESEAALASHNERCRALGEAMLELVKVGRARHDVYNVIRQYATAEDRRIGDPATKIIHLLPRIRPAQP